MFLMEGFERWILYISTSGGIITFYALWIAYLSHKRHKQLMAKLENIENQIGKKK